MSTRAIYKLCSSHALRKAYGLEVSLLNFAWLLHLIFFFFASVRSMNKNRKKWKQTFRACEQPYLPSFICSSPVLSTSCKYLKTPHQTPQRLTSTFEGWLLLLAWVFFDIFTAQRCWYSVQPRMHVQLSLMSPKKHFK